MQNVERIGSRQELGKTFSEEVGEIISHLIKNKKDVIAKRSTVNN